MAVAIESKRGHRPDGKKRTIRDMISLYAPSSESDVDAYINAIKRSHGFSGDEDLEVILKDKEKYRQLREAMERKEGYWVPDLGTGVGQKVPDEREKLVKQGWENGAPPPREAYVPPKPREVTGDLPPRTPTVVPKPEPPRTTPSQPPPRRRTEREGDDLIGLAGFANEDDWSVVATHGIHDADARVKGDLARILYYAHAPASPDDRKTGEADGLNMYIAGPGRTSAYGWKYDQRGRRRAGGEGEVEVKAHTREGHPVAAHTRSRPDRT